MTRPAVQRPKLPSVGRLGLLDPRATSYLAQLGWNFDEHGDDRSEAHIGLLWSLSRAPDADAALSALVRLAEALGGGWQEVNTALLTDRGLRGRLFAVLGSSLALADHLVANPRSWRLLAGKVTLPSVDELRRSFLDCAAEPSCRAQLRSFYRDRLLVLAALDLAPTVENEPVLPFPAVGAHLTDLADAALTAALWVAEQTVCGDDTPPRLAVIAMGKCGARELNYVSDVDVIFVGERADATTTRVAGEMMRLASEVFFEVDAALRPEGKCGELVRTVDSHAAYYQRWAKTWEFQALLKARPAVGDAELGREYLAAVMPLVWRAAEREDFVPDVRAMRRRVEQTVPADMRSREIKLGTGGLRDVEFAVQLLQLVHGRGDDSLHVASTVDALSALSAGGYIGRDDAVSLADAYGLLRVAEHRLQLRRLRRTHTVPDDPFERQVLARSMGFRPDARGDAVSVFDAEWALHAREVRRLHERLFYRPLLEAVARLPRDEIRMSKDRAADRLAALGFARPEQALAHLEVLTRGVSRTASIQRALLPVLLRSFADAADPDAGLLAYRQVSEALGRTPWYLRLLRDEGQVATRLAAVLGTGRYVATMLVRAPEALPLLASDTDLVPRPPERLAAGFADAALRQTADDDGTASVAVARGLRRVELLRTAFADLLGRIDVDDVGRALSGVADATIQAALSVALRTVPGPARPFAVIGMGRLGGEEIGYGSDADVLFVVDHAEGDGEAVTWANAVAVRLRSLLAAPSPDPAIALDADLRPEGRDGPLVRSLRSYSAYYERWSEPWEAQALLRARVVAGDAELGRRFLELVGPVRYPANGLTADQVREIRRIKGRVEAERLPRGADSTMHAKLGRGGLSDVEWTVQLLQLHYAAQHPSLQVTSTVTALVAAADVGVLDPDDATVLSDAWHFATRVRNAIRLVQDVAGDQLPTSGPVLSLLAGEQDRGDDPGLVVDEYRRVTRRAREVVERVFYERTGNDPI